MILGGVFLVWAVAMVILQWLRARAYVHFEYEDDALYLQMLDVVDRSHFDNTIHPGHRPSHLMPILTVLWPLYALLGGGAIAVWIIKAIMIGGGCFATFLIAKAQNLGPRHALFFGVLYLLLPPTISLTLSTFRPLTLSLGTLLFVLWAVAAGRDRSLLILCGVLLLFREDLALTLLLVAALVFWQRRTIAVPLGILAIAGLWFAVATWMLPSWGDVIVSGNLAGGGLGGTVAAVFESSHVRYYAALLLPLALLPLLSLETAVGLVGIAAI
ncbi:MAG: putative membrane protein, partial [Myxococcota bacterium]